MDVLNADDAIAGANAALDAAAFATSPRVTPTGGFMPQMISHAQNFEDVMLRRALQDIKRGYYVDIGACDPEIELVTRWFYEAGWRGVNVEPDPRYFPKLEERRPEDTNLQCVIGAASANVVFNVTTTRGWSTGSAQRLTELATLGDVGIRPILLPAITLEQLLALSCGREIDFLKIDAEGMEDDILDGALFVSYRPRIIVAEATLLNSQIPCYEKWEPKLLKRGYKFAWFDGLNRFYVRKEEEWRLELFKVPPCVFDNFFGVTIAAKLAEAASQAARDEAELARALAEARTEAAAVSERYEGALSEASAASQRYEAALSEAHANASAASERYEGALSEASAASQRYEAALSEASANATAASARAEGVEAELRRVTTESERRQAVFEARIEKLTTDLAQRENDYHRIQQRLIEILDSRRRMLENVRQRESECQRLQESRTEQEKEVARLTAERDKAAAQSMRWFQAVISNDPDPAGSRRQYPVQARLDQSRLGRWLAVGLERQRRLLIASADRARDRRDWALAARYFRDALDLAPDRPGLWVQYGHAIKEAGNLEETSHLAAAEGAYRMSLSLDAANADTHLQLGHVLKLQGRKAEAAEAYRRAVALAPGSPDAALELGALDSPAAIASDAGRESLQRAAG